MGNSLFWQPATFNRTFVADLAHDVVAAFVVLVHEYFGTNKILLKDYVLFHAWLHIRNDLFHDEDTR